MTKKRFAEDPVFKDASKKVAEDVDRMTDVWDWIEELLVSKGAIVRAKTGGTDLAFELGDCKYEMRIRLSPRGCHTETNRP